MRKIYYLTGATGWVGNEILKLLLKQNEEVVLLIRQETERIYKIKDKVMNKEISNEEFWGMEKHNYATAYADKRYYDTKVNK